MDELEDSVVFYETASARLSALDVKFLSKISSARLIEKACIRDYVDRGGMPIDATLLDQFDTLLISDSPSNF